MKFWVKGKFKRKGDREEDIKKLFEKYAPESRIEVKEGVVKAEVAFDKPPVEIIKEIARWKILSFRYDGNLGQESKYLFKGKLKRKAATKILVTFFKEFNPENCIQLKGKKAKVEISFDKTPIGVIEEITQWKDLKIKRIGNTNQIEEKNPGPLEEKKDSSEQAGESEVKAEPLEQTEEPEIKVETLEQTGELEVKAEPLEQTGEPEVKAETFEQPGESEEEAEPLEQTEEPEIKVEPLEQTGELEVKAEPLEQTGEPEVKAEPLEQTGEPEEEVKIPKQAGEPEKEAKKPRNIKLPELEEIAEKALSFNTFVELVGKWIQMNKRQEYFEKLVLASTKVGNISWKSLEAELKNEGYAFKTYDKIFTRNQVSKRFLKYSLTLLPFLEIMRQYKDYPFKKLEEKNIERVIEEAKKPEEARHINEKIKMKCMPKNKYFEEVLSQVKGLPIEKRAYYVLKAMELNEKSPETQEKFIKIVELAVKSKIMDEKQIFEMAGIPTDKILFTKIELSQFVNNFIRKNGGEIIPLHQFLKELQKAIMLDSEIVL